MIRGVGEDIAMASKMEKKIWTKLKSQSERRRRWESEAKKWLKKYVGEEEESKLGAVLTYLEYRPQRSLSVAAKIEEELG